MIVAFSTSSPVASAAVFDAAGKVRYAGSRPAQGAASGACLAMLAEAAISPGEVELWLADVGPGSFTGTRVGVVLAMTFGWTHRARCGGADAFDLIARDRTVAIPNRRGEWLVRRPGESPEIVAAGSVEAIGYAPELEETAYPYAARFAGLLATIERIAPEELRPRPVVPPSISTPKRSAGR